MDYDKEQVIIKMIKKYIDFNNKIVLEIGCGDGMTSSLLADETKRYIGIDSYRKSIDHAKSKFKNIDFRIGSGESIEFKDSCFEIVLFTLSLHHQNSSLALKEADRVLTETGNLIILEPTIDGELQQIFHIFNDETTEIKEALENIMKSRFKLKHRDTFNAITEFYSQTDLCSYHFDREKISPNDVNQIMEKLNQLQIDFTDHQPIYINDRINLYHLIKE